MTDRPYTDADLRAEAARQHKTLTEDPDFMGIGEQMDGTEIPSLTADDNDADVVEGTTWDELDEDDFDAAMRAIDKLLGKAADVSQWAIDLGADGLEPDERTVDIRVGPVHAARLHIGFSPAMTGVTRDGFMKRLRAAVEAEFGCSSTDA